MTGTADRSEVFGIRIDRVTMAETVERLTAWVWKKERECRFVVTPNLDHAVQLQTNPALREAYRAASLVVADGWPLVTASRVFNDPLPERVTGSDLVPNLLETLNESSSGGTVFLLGGAPGVGELAACNIQQRWRRIQVVGSHSPPFGFRLDSGDSDHAVELINNANPDVLVVGFGAPRQELWLHQNQPRLSAGVAIAAGATIDFLAGRQTRAPRWMQSLRLEWSHRLMTNPRRLAGRYARNACCLPRLLAKEFLDRRNALRTGTDL